MIPLVPLYDLSYSARVCAAAMRQRIAVIVNVDSGPGRKLDPEWNVLIAALRKAKAYVFGYIATRRRTQAQVNADVKAWAAYGVTSFFYDEYRASALRLAAASSSIANPGCPIASPCAYTIIWESNAYGFSRHFPTIGASVMALGYKDFTLALSLAKSRGISLFYATDLPDGPRVYDRLPSYFDQMLAEIAKR